MDTPWPVNLLSNWAVFLFPSFGRCSHVGLGSHDASVFEPSMLLQVTPFLYSWIWTLVTYLGWVYRIHVVSTQKCLSNPTYIKQFFSYFLLLDIFFVCISNVTPFSCFPYREPYSIPPPPASIEGVPPSTHLFFSASLPWHSPTIGHQAFTRPRASPPADA